MSALKKVQALASRLQNNRGVQTRKEVLREFIQWFSSEKPELHTYTMRLLLEGDASNGYSTGIIQFCGKQKNAETAQLAGYVYKESVKLALELWVSCIHESFGMHAKSFQSALQTIALATYIEARLDIHIQLEDMKDFAGILVDAILYSTDFSLAQLLPNPGAQNAFKQWLKMKNGGEYKEKDDQEDVDGDGGNEYAAAFNQEEDGDGKRKKKKPLKWEDVKDEDLILDAGGDDGGNDEWFDTLDFVKGRVGSGGGGGGAGGGAKRGGRDEDLEAQVADEEEEEDDDDDDFYTKYHFDDPIGQKKRSDVKKCIERFNQKKKDFNSLRMHNDVIDTYYQYSPNIIDENFNATNFLVEIHNETEFEQLQNGLDKIEKFVRDQSYKMKELVRDHFDQFVYCKDTIDQIHVMLKNNAMLASTGQMSSQLAQIEKESMAIYGTILSRTKKAKVLNETLQLIKQPSFRFLFTLPQSIKYHIMMRNYDQIIRIYKRVRNIQPQIDKNQLLKKILSELNSTVDQLRENLLAKLKESDNFGDEQEQMIAYLMELDCAEHPAIYFLKQRHANIMRKLDDVYQKQKAATMAENLETELSDEALHAQKKVVKKLCQTLNHYMPSFWKLSKAIIDAKFETQKDGNKKTGDKGGRQSRHQVSRHSHAQRRSEAQHKSMIDRQNDKIVRQLFFEVTNKFVHYIETALQLQKHNSGGDAKNRKNSHLYHTDFSKETLRLLLSAYAEMKSIKIAPTFMLNIDALMSSIVRSFLNLLFEKSIKTIASTLSQDQWRPHRDIAGVTTTPLLFMDEVCKNLQIVIDIGIKTLYDADDQFVDFQSAQQELLQQTRNSQLPSQRNLLLDSSEEEDDDDGDEYIPFQDDLSNAPSNASNGDRQQQNDESRAAGVVAQQQFELNALWLVPLIGTYYVEAHKMFADCLHELVFPSSASSLSSAAANDADGADRNHGGSGSRSSAKGGGSVDVRKINILSNYNEASSDRKLLYVLGNTIYTKDTILEKIWTKFMKKSGIIGIEYKSVLGASKNELIELYTSLEEMVFHKYVRCKTLLINRVIDNSLLCDGINWETMSEVKGIRNHCLQLLLHFVFIHNEVYNSSKQELDNVLISLLEKVSDHLLCTVKQIDSFSPSGALQILIEIDFIKSTLSKYLQPDGSEIVFKQILQLLYQWIDQDPEIIQQRKQQLTLHTQQSTTVMFSCFRFKGNIA